MTDECKCRRCGKVISREDGRTIIKGVKVTVQADGLDCTPADIEYLNNQLGKYSDGKGGCDVSICYECYIDLLFVTDYYHY